MADLYFLDRPSSSGYKPIRFSNNFYLENNIPISGNSHGGILQTPPRFFSAPSIHTHQLLQYPFIHHLQQPPPPILHPPRSLPSSQPRFHSVKKPKSKKRDKDLPAEVDRRVPSRTLSTAAENRVVRRAEELEKLSGCLFAVISPPPSSLPLPKFCVRPAKLKCNNVETAGADDGAAAADDLRRRLRLR